MEDKWGHIPMYIDGANHQAFIRYELCHWPDQHAQWVVYCPGCEQMARACVSTYAMAHEIALEHRAEEGAWMPKDSELWGPRAKWGPSS